MILLPTARPIALPRSLIPVPLAGTGIVLPPFAGWTERVQRSAATRSYPELVRAVRTGPPTLSVFSIPGVDGLANLFEYVVHHEDVLRAQPGGAPPRQPFAWPDDLPGWSNQDFAAEAAAESTAAHPAGAGTD